MVEIFFLLKKIVSLLFQPLSIVLVLLVSGLMLLWMTKKKNLGKIFITLGTILLLLASYGFLADRLAASLENRYLPLLDVKNIHNFQNIKWIVVLGGGAPSDPRLPLSSQLSPDSLTRLLEGVMLHRQLPGSRLVLSGGAVFQDAPEGETLAKTAMLMGLNENDVVRENKSMDTAEQAKLISNIVGHNQFILVTSAIHMPRSIALFRKLGMDPIAAPTHYMVVRQSRIPPRAFFPGSDSLRKMEAAIHEYLGLIWMRVQ
ncbi:MAG: YdcF family protein [Deltaproteobacteria bacterium]|nr:YdcF family protein [Deltaproteobacteria bacterium]